MRQRPAILLIFVFVSACGMPDTGPPPEKLDIPRMTKVRVRYVSPGVDSRSWAGQPVTIYRLGQQYGRVEFANGDVVLAREPHSFYIDTSLNKAYHGLDPGPTYVFRTPIVRASNVGSDFPRELRGLEFGLEPEFLARYRLPQSLLTYFAMQSNIVFVVPIDLVAASEMIRTMQDFGLGGAGRYHSGGFGHMAEVFCQGVERYGGRVLLRTHVERIRVKDGAVTGVDTPNAHFEAPIVVSNAGIQPTALRLVGEEHFDRSYLSYVRGLVPSWGIMGIRYFLDRPFFEHGMYIAFSDESVLDSDRFAEMKSGWLPDDVLVFNTVPSFYDPTLAPEGKQCVVAGTLCSSDPELPHAEALWQRLDETIKRLWPGLEDCVEHQIRYGTQQVSSLTRDAVVPGQGGECIGLAQTVGQCGRHKPSAAAPLRGLYYVGCDAGGYGCGTHQAADSGVNLAELVEREHRIRQAAF